MVLNRLVDSRDVRFVLFELLEIDKLSEHSHFSEFDRDMYEATLDLAETIAIEEVYPANDEADAQGIQYDTKTKTVNLPPSYRDALKTYYEAGFAGLPVSAEHGGYGMPESLFLAATEYVTAPGAGFTMYPHLIVGVSNLIIKFGNDEQKETYLANLLSGEWGGTMCLTEAEAGSDLSTIKTRAVRQDGNSFHLTGQKIFISAGDHDASSNIIHMVLARIEGDPEGTKGLSLFIVPKYRINGDGSNGEFNNVVTAGIEHKMGLRGSATCTLSFGDDGPCEAYLIGEERKGLAQMFQMMNESRLYVGLQALALSSAAYMHAATYAKTRIQGRDATSKERRPVAIVEHPDVRRTLLWMKSYVEGMRALTYFIGHCMDLAHTLEGEEKQKVQDCVDFLIPVCKAGNSDNSWLVTAEAIQVYGGYGYCSDYPVERFARDSKILSLYEGTNGIQAQDLTMRKILTDPDLRIYHTIRERIAETVDSARGIVDEQYISALEKGLAGMDSTIAFLREKLEQREMGYIFAAATPFAKGINLIIMAWMHLWSLTRSTAKLKEMSASGPVESQISENAEAAFYYGKVLSSRFFINTVFPGFFSIMDSVKSEENAVVESSVHIFTGTPEE